MNTSFYIAKKIAFNKHKSFSRFIIRLSTTATAISVAIMIIATAFATGFQNTIAKKIFSFWGHIRVQHYEFGKVAISEESPIYKSDTVEQIIKNNNTTIAVNSFATKSAVIEKSKSIEGVLIKGIDSKFDSNQFKPFLKKGRWINYNDSNYSKEIILSQNTASLIKAVIGDTVKSIFINSNDKTTTYRKLKLVGIFKTGVEENDKHFALADIKLIQKINNWDVTQIGGYEVFINDYKKTELIADSYKLPIIWNAQSIKNIYPNIFDWLAVMDTNRNIVFVIMSIVAIINLITCLLILVLERIKMIGILKSLGETNINIQKIFLYYASIISLRGVGAGAFFGVLICLLQKRFEIFKLDEANYYVSSAPVELIWWHVIIICVVTFILCFLALLLPTLLVKKIEPVKAVAFK